MAAVEATARWLTLDARLLRMALHEAEVEGCALRARAAAEGAEFLQTAAELRRPHRLRLHHLRPRRRRPR